MVIIPRSMRHGAGTVSGRWLVCVLLALLWMAVPAVQAATITAYVERSEISASEAFVLTFETSDSVDAEPDFTPLEKDFEILGRSQRSNLSIRNGKYSRSTQWLLNLMPRRAGDLVIPSIAFGKDKTRPLRLKVTEAPAGASRDPGSEIFIEVDANPRDPYVQQQVIFTVRLFHSRQVELSDARLSDPELRGADAIVEQVGKDKMLNINRNGRNWDVIERTYALFPQASGRVTIEPLLFEGQVVAGSSSFFDPFGQSIRTRRLRSDPLVLDVKPVPPGYTGRTWLPARRMQLHEVWSEDPPQFRAGEPITRTLALLANGLTAGQLPELAPPPPDGIKQYPDQPVLNNQRNRDGLVGLRQEKVAVIASQPGRYVLPAVEIPWWNIDTNTMEVARLPERVIEVEPAPPGSVPAPPPVPAPAEQQAEAPAAQETPDASLPVPGESTAGRPLWMWIALLLALAWIATLYAWWRSTRGAAAARGEPGMRLKPRPGALVSAVRKAASRNDAAAAKAALLEWAEGMWPGQPPQSLSEIARRTGGALAPAIEELNAALYSRSPGGWDGTALRNAFDAWLRELRKPEPQRPSRLEPLYRD